MSAIVVDVSTEELLDRKQLAWVSYREGDLVVRAKIIRGESGWPFVALPTLYRKSVGGIEIMRYENSKLWNQKKKILLEAFKNHIGANAYCPPAF